MSNEGEWTAESVGELVGGTFNGAWAIADAHNAALAAEREHWDKVMQKVDAINDEQQDQLAAERERIRVLESGTALNAVIETNKQLREQIAAEQANLKAEQDRSLELTRQLGAEREKPDRNLYLHHVKQLRSQLATDRERFERLLDLAGAQNMGIDNLAKLDELQQQRSSPSGHTIPI